MIDLITISSSVLPGSARVVGFRGVEAISRPYQIEIFLALDSKDSDAFDLGDALGAKATLTIDRQADRIPPYVFSGIFGSVELLQEVASRTLVRAVLVPKLWLLGLSQHSRIFTNKALPDIIQSVLEDGGLMADEVELRLGDYEVEEHVCQYRESDLDFLSRWMEREGIYYFFEHHPDGEKLILCDNKSYERDVVGEPVRYHPQSGDDRSAGASFRSFTCRHTSLPMTVKLKDYDELRPNLDVAGESGVSPGGTGEVSSYGHRLFTPASCGRLARIRAEEMLARQVLYSAAGTRFHLRPGYVFALEDHPREAFNTDYLTVEAHHHGNQAVGDESLKGLLDLRHDDTYLVELTAVTAKTQLRPASRTPWPRIYGYENATVDGPAESEYAQVDAHGRYNVKFKFDESSLRAGKASAFIRMMQPHGGSVEGFHFPLRKGTEVVLSFLGGDPDRPVISGVVPNALTPSPVTSANHTKNVVQTGGKNRVEMEDQGGAQYIDISSPPEKTHIHLGAHHGPHGHNWIVSTAGNGLINTGGDRNITVGGEQTEDVKGNLTEDYHSDQTTHVFGAFKETIDAGATQTISAGSTQTISGGETRDVTGGMTETITGGRTQTINGGSTETVNGDVSRTVNGAVTEMTNGSITQTTNGNITQTTNGSLNQTVQGDIQTITPATYKIVATGGMQVVAQGGWQLVAPGGTTTVDSFFDKTGGKSADAFAFKMSIVGAKVDICGGLSFGYTANKIDITQFKVDITATRFQNNPIKIETLGQAIQAAYLAVHGVAFCMIT